MTEQTPYNPVRLHAFTERDLPFLDRLATDPEVLGEFEWPGFTDPRTWRRRWEQNGLLTPEFSAVAVVAEGTTAGVVTWRPRGMPVGVTYEIGIGLAPEFRGHGLGTVAQDLLVEYLLDFTAVHRIEALTNEGNTAEQKALERLGFQREGLMRERSFLHGRYVGALMYGLFREDRRPA